MAATRKRLVSALRSAGLALVVLILLIAGLRLAVSSAPGRWAITAALDGRTISGHTLELEGLSGDPLSRLRLARLQIRDAEGVWLDARDIELDWQARSLLAQPYRIDRLAVRRLDVLRRPVSAGTEPGNGGGAPSIPSFQLGLLDLADIRLSEDLAGQAVRLQLAARADVSSLAQASAVLDINRLDAPGDTFHAELELSGQRVSGTLGARGAPDGPLAHLLGLPGQAIAADGRLDGSLESGNGHLTLTADSGDVAVMEGRWTVAEWQAEGRADIAPWGLVPETYLPLLDTLDFAASGTRQPGYALSRLSARTRDSRVIVEPRGEGLWHIETHLGATSLAHLGEGYGAADALDWSGEVERRDGTILARGEVVLTGLTTGEARAQSVSGPVTVRQTAEAYQVETSLQLNDLVTRLEQPNALLSPVTLVAASGQFAPGSREISVSDLTVQTDHARLAARGVYRLEPGEPEIIAELQIDAVERLTDLARGPVQLSLDLGDARNGTLRIDARELVFAEEQTDLLRGLTGEIRVVREDAAWRLEALNARAAGIDLTARGRHSGDRWELTGDLAVSGRLPIAPVEIEGALATAFRLEARGTNITLRSGTRSQTITAGPLRLDQPSLAVEAVWDGTALSADWMLEATRNAKPVALDGDAGWSAEAWHFRLNEGQLSPVTLSAFLARTAGELQAELAIALGDRAAADLGFAGPADDLRAGELAAHLVLASHDFPGGFLNRSELTLDGPLSGLAINLTSSGELRSPFELAATGELRLSEQGHVALDLRPQGAWSLHRISTPEPLRLTHANGAINLTGRIGVDEGEIGFSYASAEPEPELGLSLTDLPAGAIADIALLPATSGRINGTLSLVKREGLWQGEAQVDVDDLISLNVEEMDPITIRNRLWVTPVEVRAESNVSGGELEVTSWMTRQGSTPRLEAVLGDEGVAIAGRLDALGDLSALAALFLPEEIQLSSANIRAAVDLTGQRGAPELDGRIRISEGRLVATATNTVLENILINARFDGNGFELTRFNATDGRDGTIRGSGELTLPAEGPTGDARFRFERLLATHRPDLTVQTGGMTTLDLDPQGLVIAGEANIVQLRAEPSMNGATAIPEIEVREINLPKNRSAYTRSVLPVQLDYRINAERSVFVSSRAFASEWGLDLHVTGPAAKPEIRGSATLVDGDAFVLNRRFTLEEGEIRFDGQPGDARIDLTAQHVRTGFAATANIAGPIRAPTITLSSQPALPEDEILSRLLFDESVSELGAFEAAQLAAQLSGQSLLNVVGQLRDFAGIDRLDLSTDADGNIAVTGGRRFGNNVYVEVGSSGASALSQALVEWELTPQLSILSRVSADTNAEVAIRWRRDY